MNQPHVTAPSALPVTEPKARKPKQHLSADQFREAADMLAAGHRRLDVAEHYDIHWVTLYSRVSVADVEAAKIRRAENIAAGREVLPEVTRVRKAQAPRTPKAKKAATPTPAVSKPAAPPAPVVPVIPRPDVPPEADLLLVPLTAASEVHLFRQQHQPPIGWTPSELWNGFIAINANLREAHKAAPVTDPLIDKMFHRFAVQRHTPATIAEQGDDFIREHRAEKFPGLMREVFLLVSHKKHKVLGEVWQDHKVGGMTPETVFVLDPKLAEKPKLDNLLVLEAKPSGKGQQYRNFTPTRTSRSPD